MLPPWLAWAIRKPTLRVLGSISLRPTRLGFVPASISMKVAPRPRPSVRTSVRAYIIGTSATRVRGDGRPVPYAAAGKGDAVPHEYVRFRKPAKFDFRNLRFEQLTIVGLILEFTLELRPTFEHFFGADET